MKLHEMVTSADVGVDLIPERMPVREVKVKSLCDFKEKKKKKGKKWRILKKTL